MTYKALFFVLTFILIFKSYNLEASSGFFCPKEKIQIFKQNQSSFSTLVIFNELTQETWSNPNIILPLEETYDAYQQRFGIYEALKAEAILNLGYMPEVILLLHMARVSKLFFRGFDSMESSLPPVQLKSLYCLALIKSIKKFDL